MPRPFFLVITRRYLWAALVLLGCLIVLAIYSSFPLAVYTLNALPTKIIYDVMLDPGHGGIDPGGIGRDDIYERSSLISPQNAGHLGAGRAGETTRDTDRMSATSKVPAPASGRFSLMNQAQVGMNIHTPRSVREHYSHRTLYR